MKTNTLKKAFAAAAMAAVSVSAASMNAFAAADNGFSAAQIEASKHKPYVTIDSKVLTKAEAEGKIVQINVCCSNLDDDVYGYASTGLHVYYDSRLSIPVNAKYNTPNVVKGPAIADLTPEQPREDGNAADLGMKGFFVTTGGSVNGGSNGVMWTINFQMPESVAAGDVFPIDIIYKSVTGAEDLFDDSNSTEEGNLMQGWVFTKGIFNKETNNTFKAPTADVDKCAKLADIDKSYDGYIAIEDDKTTPTTAPVPTTTVPAPTTTVAVPTTTVAVPTTTVAAPATTTVAAPATTTVSAVTTDEVDPPINASTTAASSTTKAAAKATTTKKPAGTAAAKTTKKTDSPKTGVAGVGVAAAGLAVALGTAFVLRKKED